MKEQPSAEYLALQTALAGRYSIESELGRGGMGIVYLAREVSLDRTVALKLLPPELAAVPAARERFLHEARTAAKLSHPNIVPIFSVDEVDELVMFAMAYIDGESLGQRIRERGPRPPSEVARMLREVAWALSYAHQQGIVHRDVKPDNILIESSTGRALVADFGIASAAASAEAGVSERVSGTAEFMSPEQAMGRPVGPASDIYSLGVVGFFALSGKLPFEGSTPAAILGKHISEPPPKVSVAAPGVPSRLARTIDGCLAKDPDSRFSSEEELAAAFGQSLGERRELPVALRIFVKREKRIGAGGVALYVWALMAVSVTTSMMVGMSLGSDAGILTAVGTMALGLTAVPAGIIARKVRRLIKSGFSNDDVVAALKVETERSREEGAFEFGTKPSLYEKVVRTLAAGGLGTALVAAIATAFTPFGEPLAQVIAGSTFVGLSAGVLATYRLQIRTDVANQLRGAYWRSRLGRWTFKLAGLGLKRKPALASATYRPTEFAIGMEADRLFEALPRPMRKQLADLPEVVRKLEVDAQKMRNRIEELNEVLTRVRIDHPRSRSLDESPHPDLGDEMAERQRELEEELLAARDKTQGRLADAVAALETIRLGLLRMQAGAGSVESMTGDLAVAREVAGEVDALMQAQGDVDRLLGGEGPDQA
jgi:serine/threonine-protein kinase